MRFSCASIFTDHMVLQRRRPVAVFGKGPEGETVEAEFIGHTASAPVRHGEWLLFLPAMDERGAHTLRVRCAGEELAFSDVVLGEVFLAGGQSNMELILENAESGAREIPASLDPDLRYFHVLKTAKPPLPRAAEGTVPLLCVPSPEYLEEPEPWVTSSPETAGQFSAVGYHVGKRLRAALGVPVGLIGCNWGGTSASCWVSRETLAQTPGLRVYLDDYDRAVQGQTTDQYQKAKADYADALAAYAERMARVTVSKEDMVAYREATKDIVYPWPPPMGPDSERRPHGLYETMLSRVFPYTLAGALWYQGEEDSGTHPELYETLLTALMRQWRRDFREEDLFFGVVQLPGFAGEDAAGEAWGKVRLAQAAVCGRDAHAALAVVLDAGERDNVHPIDKETVGNRLADQILCHLYGAEMDVRLYAPKRIAREGNALVLRFDTALHSRGESDDFQLRGPDGAWARAEAKIEGSAVRLTAPGLDAPCAARYALTNWVEGRVYQANGIPLPPFAVEAE